MKIKRMIVIWVLTIALSMSISLALANEFNDAQASYQVVYENGEPIKLVLVRNDGSEELIVTYKKNQTDTIPATSTTTGLARQH